MTENKFQLSKAAVEKYENLSVPALFAPLAEVTLVAVELPENAHVLDVACGTGIVARHVVPHLRGKGRIVGTDLNADMINVARANMPDSPHTVEWVVADVGDMPFADREFDIAFLQQGLQFFPDKPAALREINRVLAPGGTLCLTCWKALSPLVKAISESLRRHVGQAAAEKSLAPFSFRDGDFIKSLLLNFGYEDVCQSDLILQRKILSVRGQILSSPYEPELRASGEEVIGRVVAEVEKDIGEFRTGDYFTVPQKTHLIRALAF